MVDAASACRADGHLVGSAVVDRQTAREVCVRLLEALEDFPAYQLPTAEQVREVLDAAAALGDPELVWRARLFHAQHLGRGGRPDEAVRLLWQVLEHAELHGPQHLLARSHLELSWTYRDIGDHTAYLHHAVRSVELLDDETPGSVRALHLFRLADALDECGSWDEALARYQEAEAAAVEAADPTRQVTCLNNRAYGEYTAGDLDAATTTIDRLLRVCAEHGLAVRGHTLDTLARIRIAQGRYEEACSTVHQAMETYRQVDVRELMAPAEFLLTLASAERLRGRLDAAQAALDQCKAIAVSAGLASVHAGAEEEQAELFAAGGDFESAFHTYRDFHRAQAALLSERRAAQSRLQQIALETVQARAEAARFRDQAERDSLTGLPNRRFLDRHLAPLLERSGAGRVPRGRRAERSGNPLPCVAMVDIDHFKRINDTCSHAAGDEVLAAVAAYAAAVVGLDVGRPAHPGRPDELAVRLGGEEFVLVLAGRSRDGDVERLERFRTAVAGHDWTPWTGGLPVTVSIGATWARHGDTQQAVLRRADELLYAAKRDGRNRVHAERRHGPPPAR
jgi:diguanylate cyclase (GGDEF)-like protein